MNISSIVSILSMLIAAGALTFSIITGAKKNTKEDSAQIAQMMTMLNGLASDMKEIKDDFRRDIAELKASHQKDHDKIVVLEQSVKAAWHRIDEIRGIHYTEGSVD